MIRKDLKGRDIAELRRKQSIVNNRFSLSGKEREIKKPTKVRLSFLENDVPPSPRERNHLQRTE